MSASLAHSQPSNSCSPSASHTPPVPASSSTSKFQLAHSPLFASHTRARASHPAYPPRQPVSDSQLDFCTAMADYKPPDFTDAKAAKHSPDPEHARDITATQWSQRPSSHPYVLEGSGTDSAGESSGRPWNPFGRTGLRGRGKLYYWGPNHAADCILLRRGGGTAGTGTQLLVIKRGDTGEYALVGGMIDKGETPEHCIKREFGEEAMGIPEAKHGSDSDASKPSAEQQRLLDAIFAPANTRCVYRGYVDDARNTDNAWLETAAFLFTLPDSVGDDEVQRLLVAGSDASSVQWVECGEEGEKLPQLYASHSPLVKLALKLHNGSGGVAEQQSSDGTQSKI